MWQWSINPTDPTQAQYSILDTVESFRGADGKFTLRFEWVASDGAPLLPQTWRQTTNPVSAVSVPEAVRMGRAC